MIRHLLFACILIASLHVNAQSPTDPALGFNVFVQNGATLVSSETEGPVAIGGDLTIGGSYNISTNNTGFFNVDGVPVTLVTGGKVIYNSGILTIDQNGYVQLGNCTGSTIWYTDMSGYYSPMRITPGSDYNGTPSINMQVSSNTIGVSASNKPVCSSYSIDFGSAFTQMKSHSQCMSTLADNAVLTNPSGTVIPHSSLPPQVKITLNSGLNVLNVTGSDLSAVTDFTYNNQPDASHVLVINVDASGTYAWRVYNSAGIGRSQCPYILYNFYNTTSLSIVGSGAIEGTVYAPFADITKTVNVSNIEGQVIAQSYYHAGGEDHYAVFSPIVSNCGGPIPTVASFSINNVLQCMEGNYFSFVSSVTGTPPFTYHWTFGDGTTSTESYPVKSYSATGTYSVTLVVTGAGGSDSVTHTASIVANPTTGFTTNDTIQSLTGNSFVFTSNGVTTGNTYSWDFGDYTYSTAANPVKTYSAPGTYIVHQHVTGLTGCTTCTCVHQVVYVICDSVTSGNGGGLESQSLGDLVSRRMINNIKNSVDTRQDYSKLPTFSKNLSSRTTNSTDRLKQFTPATLDASTNTLITTPADITSLTAAVDVFSVDYVNSNNAKAVVLGITTTGKPYNHTKSICDRFRGATLLGTNNVTIQGYNFIQFQLQQQSGEMEYCIAFAAGKSAGNNNFHLQSKWLISEYASDDSVFNFQVWAASPANTEKLVNEIVTNLAAVLPIQQTDVNYVLPPAYIASGKRNKGFLDLAITNNTISNNGMIIFEERKNEFSGIDTLEIPFTLATGTSNVFHIPIYDGYEYEGHLFLNDTLTDDVYMADGNWSMDYDQAYTTLTYKPDNNYSRVYTDGEYPLYRNITVSGTSKADYISVYKFITSGEDKVDLTAYHSFKFLAKGGGKVQIRLIKSSISKWADQYYTTMTLDTGSKNYQVSFDDFTSDNLSAPFDASDVTAVVYTFLYTTTTNFNFFADDQAFSPTAVTSYVALQSKKVTVSPNPTSGQFQCNFAVEQDRDLTLVLTDLAGNTVYKQAVHAVTGQNSVTVTLPAEMPESMLFMKLGNSSVKYEVSKITLLHK